MSFQLGANICIFYISDAKCVKNVAHERFRNVLFIHYSLF